MIPDEVKDVIRARVDLADVMRAGGVPLRRSGSGWRGPCPFEARRRGLPPGEEVRAGRRELPSKFSVRGAMYKCFACPEKGDLFSWLMWREALEFPAALARAAQLAGVTLQPIAGRRSMLGAETSAQASTLAHLVALSRDTARARTRDTCIVAGVDLSAAIQSGEVGMLPPAHVLRRALAARGVTATRLTEIGLQAGSSEIANRWMLWASQHGELSGGRPLGAPRPLIGLRRARSRGWVSGPVVPGTRITVLTADDITYLALRSQGLGRVALVLSEATCRDPRGIAGLRDLEHPPTLLVPAGDPARQRALCAATALLASSPYLRVAECPPASDALGADPLGWRTACVAATRAAGHVFDWQMHRIRVETDLTSEIGQSGARDRLRALVLAMPSKFRAWYLDQVERAMGLSLGMKELVNAATLADDQEPDHRMRRRIG